LSAILKVPIKKIGLKATTSEKIGIIGNNEAISVQSIVNLKDLS
jgi:2C-methyl-D-erythritol 2,4-cyclodiphosphate synthase